LRGGARPRSGDRELHRGDPTGSEVGRVLSGARGGPLPEGRGRSCGGRSPRSRTAPIVRTEVTSTRGGAVDHGRAPQGVGSGPGEAFRPRGRGCPAIASTAGVDRRGTSRAPSAAPRGVYAAGRRIGQGAGNHPQQPTVGVGANGTRRMTPMSPQGQRT